ncbi:MAG: hypothetical protein PHD97_00055 [Bacteroidales bacterium]|nr:hypothetical protein [Bacteroidales bacterium]
MKRLLFAYIIVNLFVIAIFSQNSDYTKVYYPFTNKAELNIIENNYKKALRKYKKAFDNAPHAFARDLYNATLCAIRVNKLDFAYKCMDSLISKGLNIDFFEINNEFDTLKKDYRWEKFKSDYPIYKKIADKRINKQLSIMFRKMEDDDQKFRYDYETFGDTIKKIDSMNMKIFLDIIDKYDFPCEEIIGINSSLGKYNESFYIVLHHNCQKFSLPGNEKLFNLKNILIKAIKDGKYDKYTAAYLLILQNDSTIKIGDVGITQIINKAIPDSENKYYIQKYLSKKQKKEYDVYRAGIGLETLNDFYKKLIFFHINKNHSPFKFYVKYDKWVFNNELYSKFIKSFVELKLQ